MIYKTIANRRIETHKAFNLPYKPLPGSTMNENLSGVTSANADAVYDVKLGYFMLGLRYGPDMTNTVYSASMATLFRPAPLLSILDDRDYEIGVEGRYRLMKRVSVNGVLYRFYFAKKLEATNSVTTSLAEYNSDGSYSDLVIGDCIGDALFNKSPIDNHAGIKDVVATTKIILRLELTDNDALKVNDAISLYYGGNSLVYSEGLKYCREIGLLTGMDLKKNEPVNSGTPGVSALGVTAKVSGKPYYYDEAMCCELGYISVLDTDITIKDYNGDNKGFPLNSGNEQVIEMYIGAMDMIKVNTSGGTHRCV